MPHPILLVSTGLALLGNAIFDPREEPEDTKAEGGAGIDEEGAEEEVIHRRFAIGTASLGSIATAVLLPPPAKLFFTVAGVTGVVHNFGYSLKKSYKSLVEENRVSLEVVDSIAVSGLLLGHYYLLCAFGTLIYYSGQKLMLRAKKKSQESVIEIFGDLPGTVWVLIDDVEAEIPLDELRPGDVVVVIAGGPVPADGVVVDGVALIDQHLLTGESQPAEKVPGDQVYASTVVLSGRIHVRVKESGSDTVVAKIEDVFRRTSAFTSSIQLKGEEVADRMALPTLAACGLALVTKGPIASTAVACGYVGDQVTIVAPLSTLNYLTIASRHGILIKDGRALESLGDVDTIIFDKTGTVTQVQPQVENIHLFNGYEEKELLRLAATAEARQAHPIAKAISNEAHSRGIGLPDMGDVDYELGYGVRMSVPPHTIRVGSVRFVEMEGIPVSEEARSLSLSSHEQGASLVMVAVDDELGGAIELSPTVRPEVRGLMSYFRQRNLSVHLVSGDHSAATRQLAEDLGIENYRAEVLPEDKAEIVRLLKAEGRKICFVGDGINDSIAMKEAHVSVSLSGASAVATDTAQVVLIDGSLAKLDRLFDLGQELETNLNVGVLSSIVPGVLTIGGVFFMGVGVFGSILIYTVGLGGGLVNSTMPLIRHRNDGSSAVDTR